MSAESMGLHAIQNHVLQQVRHCAFFEAVKASTDIQAYSDRSGTFSCPETIGPSRSFF